MAQESTGLSGDALIKLNVITGANDESISYADLEKHFGDIDQYTTSQYKWSQNWNTDQNAFATNLKQYIPSHMTSEDFKYLPTIKVNGKFQVLFDTPEFLDFYKENFPDVQKYGTEYQVNSMPLQPHQTDRINALQAQIYMMQAADIFKKNSKTLDFNKLSEKINAYKLSPEQEEDYQRRSVELASEIGVPYKDPDGKYYYKGFDAAAGELVKFSLNEDSLQKGKLKDGKFVIDGEGDLLAVFKNGNLNYQNLIVENNITSGGKPWFEGGIVQLADGTKKKIPNTVTLSHEEAIEGLSLGFYDGNIKITGNQDVILPYAKSEYEVDDDGNILIKADETLEFIVNSPVIQITDGGKILTGYAGAGMQIYEDYAESKSARKINLDTGEVSDISGGSVSLGDFYYKDKNNKVRFLQDGKATLAHRDVGIDEAGGITWNGKAVADSVAMNFLGAKSAIDSGWTPVVYDNGKYDLEMVQPNGWVYNANQGWFYRKPAEEGGEWRWYSADGSGAGSDTESNKGIWLYTDDQMLARDVQQFVTADDLAVYRGSDGAWRSWTSSEILDTDGSGTYDETEMLDHLKYQRGEQLDEGIFTQEEYDSSISEIDERINVINQQPIETETPETETPETETPETETPETETPETETPETETPVETAPGEPAYWEFAGQQSGSILEGMRDENGNLIGSYSLYDADGNYLDKQIGQPIDLPSKYDFENQVGEPVYHTTQISAGKKLYNIHDGLGNFIDQQDTPPDLPSYAEKRQEWIDSGKVTGEDTGWMTEKYQSLDLKNSEFETLADGSIRLINPVFTGDVLEGEAAIAAAEADANNLARLYATAPGAQAGLSDKMISAGIDKLIGPEWNPIRWLNKLNGAEYNIDLTQAYTRAQNAAAESSSSNQNLSTYVGAGRLAGKPWLNPGGTIQEQAAPFLQQKYVLNKDTGELEENLLYDPSLSDFIYNKGPDGIEGTDDDFEQMWTPSWLLPWDYRELEAEWRVGYEGALKKQMDYFNSPVSTRPATQYDVDMGRATAVGDPIGMSAFDLKQEEGMQALYDRGFYNDPNKIYKVTDPATNEVSYVDYKGNPVLDPGDAPPGGYQEYKKGLYDQLTDDRLTWEFGDEDDVNSRMGRRKQFKEAEKYYNDLNNQLEELATNKKLENRARLYNFGADTSSKAAARTDAFNNTAKAILYGGQGISKNMFERQEPAEGYDFFGNKKADPNDPFQVAVGGNVFNIHDKANIGQTPEQVLLNAGFTLPKIPEGNIFLEDRVTPTAKTTATTTP